MYRIAVTVDPEIAVPPTYYGGIERVVYQMVETLIDRGHDVVLFASPDSTTRAHQIGYGARRSTGSINTLRNMATLTNQLGRGEFDVVHSFSRLAYLLPLMPARLPKLMTYQRQITPRSVSLAKRLSRGSLHFSAVSQAMTANTQHLVDWHVIPNMVDTQAMAPIDSDIAHASRPLVFLGRIESIKGVHLAIECARRTSRRLLIAGNVPEQATEYFDTQIKPQLDDQIEYIGAVNDNDKRQLLAGASAMLMPILWDEPFGIVMAEALACGTPVVALNRGSVPEVIEHGRTGFICEDIDAMVASIEQLGVIDRNDCRLSAIERFSTHSVVSRYESVYEQIIRPGRLERALTQ